MNRLNDKIAVITGAAQGIGRGIALCLAEEGAHIVINDLAHTEAAQETLEAVQALGRQALMIPADVADRTAVAALFAQATAHFGRVDIAVANAAHSVRQPVIEAEWEQVQRTLEVTQFGVYHVCQAAARQMVQQAQPGQNNGKLLITGSVLQEVPFPTSAPYNMAKAAVNHFARTLAAELAPHHINVNVINPGWIDTPGERKFASEEEIQQGGRLIPWGRLGQPRDIGKAAAFLVSADADYITGTSLRVDGGYVIGLRPVAH
ncbi:MAG: SDR family oxidoreductase [Caldilineaceae bacterium]|nr:SDR family oxidoreductase [Caldilineaceae bacterium]MCB0142470.1 SDR family oxidoreductase [Caldilineaceae bacterium]